MTTGAKAATDRLLAHCSDNRNVIVSRVHPALPMDGTFGNGIGDQHAK